MSTSPEVLLRSPTAAGEVLLDVRDLCVTFDTEDGPLAAVKNLSFSVAAGRTLAIVGESGSGKSVATQTMVGLTRGARITGSADFEGTNLLTASPARMRELRGSAIGMVFQDPLTSLHPQYRIGWQIEEALHAHLDISRADARARAVDLLREVGIPNPEGRVRDYPHQFSGGMRQRAMIAMALALNPRLLIADEPTTALDVTVQAQVLDLMRRMQAAYGSALIIITHDLGVVADLADDVLVMYAGRAVEVADRRSLYYLRHHPYTDGLLSSLPDAPGRSPGERLTPIPGTPPSLLTPPPGCSFAPRCRWAVERCRVDRPELRPVGAGLGHVSACHLPAEALGGGAAASALRQAWTDSGGTLTATRPTGSAPRRRRAAP